MTGRLAKALIAGALLGAAGSLPGPVVLAAAAPPPPADLTVAGGEETWRPARAFRLLWANPAQAGGAAIAAVHYRLRDPQGGVAIWPVRIGWPATVIDRLEVPGPPGAYTAEVWLEDASGETGAPAAAKLRFDDARPASVEPLVGATWVGRTAFPLPIRIDRPDGVPASGIRGYAVSIAPAPGVDPCAAPDRCSVAETDLHGGIADDEYLVADLPEGAHVVRALAVSGAGMASPSAGRAVLRVDKTSPVTTLAGASEGWVSRPVTLIAAATDSGSGMAEKVGGVPPYTAIAVDGGAPIAAPGASVETTLVAEGEHRIAYYARDAAGNVDDGGSSNGVANPPPRQALVRIDRTPPTVRFANAQRPSDPELIRVTTADSLAGADPGRGWIGIRRSGSGDAFEPLPAEPSADGELRARWDSDAAAPGEYELRAVAFDRAGNAAVTLRRANGTPMVLTAPLRARTEIRAGLTTGGRAVSPRRGASLSGRLATAAGQPLAATPVAVTERFPPGAHLPDRITRVTTDAGGGFTLRLPAGPSREVVASFEGTPTLGRARAAMPLPVRGRVLLRASARVAEVGGAPLVFAGGVTAAPGEIPPGGKSVQLQFRLPRMPWTEFRTIQTDRRGRFRYVYRFSDDDSRGVRFLFRALAPAQGAWPYEPGSSRPVAVHGI